jgi:hypothetical protein
VRFLGKYALFVVCVLKKIKKGIGPKIFKRKRRAFRLYITTPCGVILGLGSVCKSGTLPSLYK